ncbi:hypothetical protein C8T65DRAFT_172351 [Cerioporus squamosus]|nr:hypothetical protein C8T65DRAFT_172351 [Cerioporus squamosus]
MFGERSCRIPTRPEPGELSPDSEPRRGATTRTTRGGGGATKTTTKTRSTRRTARTPGGRVLIELQARASCGARCLVLDHLCNACSRVQYAQSITQRLKPALVTRARCLHEDSQQKASSKLLYAHKVRCVRTPAVHVHVPRLAHLPRLDSWLPAKYIRGDGCASHSLRRGGCVALLGCTPTRGNRDEVQKDSNSEYAPIERPVN